MSADGTPAWRLCEIAWDKWLREHGHTVVRLNAAVGNTHATDAPMIETAAGMVRAPDILSHHGTVSQYWEIKYRSRADADPLTGVQEYWVDRDAFDDYLALSRLHPGTRVWLVVYEAPSATAPGRWLKADVLSLSEEGHPGVKIGQNGSAINAWIWPVGAMILVEDGPPDDDVVNVGDLLTSEGPGPAIDRDSLIRAERVRRKRRTRPVLETQSADSADVEPPVEASLVPAFESLGGELSTGLKVLSASLGLRRPPQYSVLRVGPLDDSVQEVLGLLHYGIRVFLVTDEPLPEQTCREAGTAPFEEVRLLERTHSPLVPGEPVWLVDGQGVGDLPESVIRAITSAEDASALNWLQYKIVHAPADTHVLVTAGAGTGKTETMAERFVFLLATDAGVTGLEDVRPAPLRADQIALVTFTRDAAAEMRSRLSRALVTRRRLCNLLVFPVTAWMMQMSAAEISTIHTFAKRLIARYGGQVGFAPDLRVSALTMEFRAVLHAALSTELSGLYDQYPRRVAAAHEWQRHLEALWNVVEDNGARLMTLAPESADAAEIGWSQTRDTFANALAMTDQRVLTQVGAEFAEICRDHQVVPTAQLVPLAHDVLQRSPKVDEADSIRYLFVDEFQDTDAGQMDLLLEFARCMSALLFVVGDQKQGIYRFRGAQGDAFEQLLERESSFGAYSLTRNFRSGAELLNSLDSFFAAWNRQGLLTYTRDDRLTPAIGAGVDESKPIRLDTISSGQELDGVLSQVRAWRAESTEDSIAILCRYNSQAYEVREKLQAAGVHCDIRVGRDFFRTPAVREARALLAALADPDDVATLLQLLETRWGPGVATGPPLRNFTSAEEARWDAEAGSIWSWGDRIASLAHTSDLWRRDLEAVSARLRLLRDQLSTHSVLGLLIELAEGCKPEQVVIPGEDDRDRRRYLRCLDHLLTLMDQSVASGYGSLNKILDWLTLQIATNHDEDEPQDVDEVTSKRTTIALTVHRAKGLEYDRVLIPFTKQGFLYEPDGRTTATLLSDPTTGQPSLLWDWSYGTHRIQNYVPGGPLRLEEERQRSAEEARLLYVAMTRARKHLLVYVNRRTYPRTWGSLLNPGAS